MIIDKLKEFTAKFRREENNDDSPEILGGIQDPDIYIGDMYGPAPRYDDDFGICVHDDEINDSIPLVYGPAPGYDDEDLDICDPNEDVFIERKDTQE